MAILVTTLWVMVALIVGIVVFFAFGLVLSAVDEARALAIFIKTHDVKKR